jgi:surfeit locus 1 family protein
VVPEFVYRRVLIRGKWDRAHTMLLSPRVREGVHGFHVIMPLFRENGSTVLVDRGFVSREFVNSLPMPEGGEVEVLGMLRTSQKRNFFTPDNKPADREWYWADVDTMAEYAGGENGGVQPVLVEEIFGEQLIYSNFSYSERIKEGHAGEANTRMSKGIPVGRPRTVELRNSHLSYVITW